MSLDVTRYTLLCYMCMSVLQKCGESVTSSLCMESLSLQECCKGRLEHAVSEFSVDTSYSVRQVENDTENPWRLDAHVTWDPPNSEEQFQYALNLNFTISPEEVMKSSVTDPRQGLCSSSSSPIYYRGYPPSTCLLSDETWHILNGTSFDATDLYFGFQYRFLIRTFEDGVPSANLTCMYGEQFHTPDCYAKTRDENFCRTRVTAVSSAPVNLTVTNIVYETDVSGNFSLSLIFEWTDPLLVNGNVTNYRAYLTDWNGSAKVGSSTQEVIDGPQSMPSNSTDVEKVRYRALFTGYIRKEQLLYIEVYPEVLVTTEAFGRIRVTQARGTPAEMVFDPDDFVLDKSSSTPGTTTGTTAGHELTETENLVLISGSLLVALVVVVVCTLTISRHCGKTKVKSTSNEVFLPFHEIHGVTQDKSSIVEPIFRDKEIFNYARIEEQEIIGNGQYGVVIKGRALLFGKDKWVRVAIKKPKQASASDEILEDFKNEIRLMIELGKHPHIISVLGCCTIEQPYYLITDFMEYGDLLHFLQKCYDIQSDPPDPIYKIETVHQVQISRQIASGMDYVAGTRFFHGDLAARNILVGKDLWVKITDFGLTDSLYQKGYTRLNGHKRRPYKWYDPEAIERQFCTLKTDIWSYGILLWEIFTFGRQIPYHGMTVQEVLYRLKTGYRLPQPPECPATMYGVMQACWEKDTNSRPSFGEILQCLEHVLIKIGDQTNYILASSDEISGVDPSSGKNSLLNRITSLENNSDDESTKDCSSNAVFSDQSLKSDSDYVTGSEGVVTEPVLDEDFYHQESVEEE